MCDRPPWFESSRKTCSGLRSHQRSKTRSQRHRRLAWTAPSLAVTSVRFPLQAGVCIKQKTVLHASSAPGARTHKTARGEISACSSGCCSTATFDTVTTQHSAKDSLSLSATRSIAAHLKSTKHSIWPRRTKHTVALNTTHSSGMTCSRASQTASRRNVFESASPEFQKGGTQTAHTRSSRALRGRRPGSREEIRSIHEAQMLTAPDSA